MSLDGRRVYLYIFHTDDEGKTDEKLRVAAKKYLSFLEGADAVTDEIVIARTDRGKPYFPDCPRLHCSASHSGDYFICAMAGFSVGADIQLRSVLREETPQEAQARLKRIAKRFFSRPEAEYMERDTCNRFFDLWTARESYVKYTGQGIDDTFADICVLPDGTGHIPAAQQAGEITAWHAQGVVFKQLRILEPYTLCVCAAEDFSVEIVWLTAETK